MTALPTTGTFTQVDPSHVAAVGPAAAILFARISWRAQATGEWTATRAEMAAETGLSPAMIRTAVDVLREREWVATRRVSVLDSTLIWSPIYAGQPEKADSTSRDGESRMTPPAESAIPSLETGKTDTPTPAGALFDAPPLRSVPTPSELDAEFARFWELYPRRTAKKAARAAYGKARRTTSVQAIATGLRAQLPSLQAREPQYVPHPTTWLNQGRWEDDVQPVTAGPRTDPFASPGAPLPPPRGRELYA